MSEFSFEVKSTFLKYQVNFVKSASDCLEEQLRPSDFVLIDSSVHRLYPEISNQIVNVGHEVIIASENAKEFHQLGKIIERLIESGFSRTDRLIGIGGGITQDITSFISSILFRGCEWMFFPTNLLTQCDSCIGSKTSINYGKYKNQLGGFYPPSKIYIDVGFNLTVQPSEIRSGIGEMLHYFFVNSEEDLVFFCDEFSAASSNLEVLQTMIVRSLDIKKAMVERDEYDRGPRNVFNYGHSFGHALESVTSYGVPHGIAVAYGMDLANLISCKLGHLPVLERNRYREIISRVYETGDLPAIDASQFVAALRKDKKNEGSQIKVILTKGVGQMFKTTLEITEDVYELISDYFERRMYNQSI